MAPGIKAIVIRSVSSTLAGPFWYGRPAVAVAWSNSAQGDAATSTALVIRCVFSEAKP